MVEKASNYNNHNDLINFSISRNLINIAKDFLCILEDLKSDGVISDEYYQRLRSRILGRTNDSARDLQEMISKFNIELKKN